MFWNQKKIPQQKQLHLWSLTHSRKKQKTVNKFLTCKKLIQIWHQILILLLLLLHIWICFGTSVPGNPVCAKRIKSRKVPTSVRKINLTFGLLHRLERWRKSHIGIVIAGKMASEKVWRKAESKKCESASNYQCPCIHWQVTQVDKEPIVKLLSRFKNQFWPWVCTDHCLHP